MQPSSRDRTENTPLLTPINLPNEQAVVGRSSLIQSLRQHFDSRDIQESLSLSFLLRQATEFFLVMGNGYIFYNSLRHIIERKFNCIREPVAANHTQIVCPNRAILPTSVLMGANAWYVNSVLSYRSTNEFIDRFSSSGPKVKVCSFFSFILGLLTISPVTLYSMSHLINKRFKQVSPVEIFDFIMSMISTLANGFVYGNSYFHLQRVLSKLKRSFLTPHWPTKTNILGYALIVLLATLGYGYNNYRYSQPMVYHKHYTPGGLGTLERLGIGVISAIIALLRFPLLLDSGVQLLDFLRKEKAEIFSQWQEGYHAWAIARAISSLGFFTFSSLSTLCITSITQQSIVASHSCSTHRSRSQQQRCHNVIEAWSWIDGISVAFVAAIINFVPLPGSFSTPRRTLLSLTLLLSILLFVGFDSVFLDRFRPVERNMIHAGQNTSSRLSFWFNNQSLENVAELSIANNNLNLSLSH